MAALRHLIAGLAYPSGAVCLACGRLRVDVPLLGLCAQCFEGLASDDQTPAIEGLDGVWYAYPYRGTAGRLVRALKYDCVRDAAAVLAEGMLDALPQGAFDALVPVPLHAGRRRQRGFNQAAVLCGLLSAQTGLPVLDTLVRTRATAMQARLTARERAGNVQGAFAAQAPATGRRLLLVDDVLTTGATALACAQALRGVGAARVGLLTAAFAAVHEDQ